MGRRIVTEQLQGKANPPTDKYSDRLLKYIPTEAVAFWLAVSRLVQGGNDDIPKTTLLWLLFAVGLILTCGWMFKQTKEPNKETAWTQIVIACGAFVVWVFADGDPFATLSFYRPLYGSLLLITYTALVALVIPPEK